MDDDDQQELHSLAELYAVGALTPEQDAAFAEHLPTCPDCQALVGDYLETLAELVPEGLQVRSHVRTDVLARIRELPQVPRDEAVPDEATRDEVGSPSPSPSPDPPSTDGPSSAAGLGPTSHPSPSPPPVRQGGRARWAALGAIFALAACLGLFAVVERPWEGPDDTERIGAVVAAPDARTFETQGDAGTLTVVLSPSQGTAVLTAEGLPPVASGHVYQAWWIDPQGAPVSAGPLTGATGSRSVTVLSGSAVEASQVAITVEPDGGSRAPTTPVVVGVDLA